MRDLVRNAILSLSLAASIQLAACGSDGGGPSGSPPPGPGVTRLVGTTSGIPEGSTVCVDNTSFCTNVDGDGNFTLAADIGGDLVLRFAATDFAARLALNDVPPGATVHIEEITCNPATGRCAAADVMIVGGNSAPRCDLATAAPSILWPPNHDLVRIGIAGVSDPDGDAIEIEVTDVEQDEAVDAAGSGNTAPDATVAPLAVRAERSGDGNGRVYTIFFEANDDSGANCSGVVQVCVPHDQGNDSACVDDGPRFGSLASHGGPDTKKMSP